MNIAVLSLCGGEDRLLYFYRPQRITNCSSSPQLSKIATQIQVKTGLSNDSHTHSGVGVFTRAKVKMTDREEQQEKIRDRVGAGEKKKKNYVHC